MQFVISHLASWLRTRRFSEPSFRPSGATNHWENTAFRDFPTFSRTWIFFLLRLSFLIFFLLLFSSLTLPISAFHLSILSEVWLLNFLRLWHPMTLFASFTLSFKTQLSFAVCINVLAQVSPSDFLDCWKMMHPDLLLTTSVGDPNALSNNHFSTQVIGQAAILPTRAYHLPPGTRSSTWNHQNLQIHSKTISYRSVNKVPQWVCRCSF